MADLQTEQAALAESLDQPEPTDRSAPRPTATPAPFKLPSNAVWIALNFASADFSMLFTEPDQWDNARRQIDVFQFYTQIVLDGPCTICGDNLLSDFVAVDAFRKLDAWRIPIALEVGSVKEWGCTGQREFEVADFVILNVESKGGNVSIFAMDEHRLDGESVECGYAFAEIAEKTTYFMNEVHRTYPEILIGDIEPFPHYPVDELKQWILSMEAAGVDLTYFHLDVDVERVRVAGQDVAADLRSLATFCQLRGFHFDVILTLNWRESGSDWSYYQSTMQWVRTVNEAMGRPQTVIFQSWKGPAANGQHLVPINPPEDDPNTYSHTRMVLNGLGAFNP